MSVGSLASALQPDDARLHHHKAQPRAGATLLGGTLQTIGCRLAPTDTVSCG